MVEKHPGEPVLAGGGASTGLQIENKSEDEI